MTSHQQTVVNQLRQEFEHVNVRRYGEPSFYVDCLNLKDGTYKTFRISPSGFCQDVTPERVS